MPPALFFVEVGYFDGPPDVYQLPFTISTGVDADEVTTHHPDSVVTSFASSTGLAIVHDATTREEFRQALLTLIENNRSLPLSTVFTPNHGIGALGASEFFEAEGSRVEGPRGKLQTASHTQKVGAKGSYVDASAEHPPVIPVAPKPLNAQPGEAAGGAPSDQVIKIATAQKIPPGESPAASDIAAQGGRLEARGSNALAEMLPSQPLPSRIGSAEQSNTSIHYGDRLILKFFRRLQPGENPDVEIGRFLTEVAHFPRVAPFLGEISITPPAGERTTVAMLQGLVASDGDGWQWFLRELRGLFERVASLSPPADSPTASFLTGPITVPESLEPARKSLEAATLLGRRTAEMHLALSGRTDYPAFAPEPFTAEDLARDARRIEAQIASALGALKSRLSTVDDSTSDAAGLLLSKRLELISQGRALTATPASGQRIRIHGDYHLGQTLRTGEDSTADFVLLDFEGEPLRSLEERRGKQSPLRDVAGMIRSFSYVAQAALNDFLGSDQDGTTSRDREVLAAWARAWERFASAGFLWTYRESIAPNQLLLPHPRQSQELLRAYLLEKALYELTYELNHRPAWLRIPIAGILSLQK